MKEKKITIKDTALEPTPDGINVVRVTLLKEGKEYIKGARYTDLQDPRKKKSIYRAWKKDIEKAEAEKAINEDDVEANIKALIGEELKEDE
jgi:CRISPR/Cas system CSM-associated protein Csm4 (group 5 of RAMP superfamily)